MAGMSGYAAGGWEPRHSGGDAGAHHLYVVNDDDEDRCLYCQSVLAGDGRCYAMECVHSAFAPPPARFGERDDGSRNLTGPEALVRLTEFGIEFRHYYDGDES